MSPGAGIAKSLVCVPPILFNGKHTRGTSTMTDSNGRFLTAIFCDDIRYEKGDKESYMGCYLQENLFVSSVPVGLSRFCVHAIAYTPTKNPFRSLTFLVVQDSNQEIARLQIPENGYQR